MASFSRRMKLVVAMSSLALFVGLVIVSIVLVAAGIYGLTTGTKLWSLKIAVWFAITCLSFGLVEFLVIGLGGSQTWATFAGLAGVLLSLGGFRLDALTRRRNQAVVRKQHLGVLSQLASAGVAAGADIGMAIKSSLELPGDKQWRELRYAVLGQYDPGYISHSRLSSRLREVGETWDLPELARLADIVAVSDVGGSSKHALERFSQSLTRSVGADTLRDGAQRSQAMLVPVGLLFSAFAILLITVCIQLISGLSI